MKRNDDIIVPYPASPEDTVSVGIHNEYFAKLGFQTKIILPAQMTSRMIIFTQNNNHTYSPLYYINEQPCRVANIYFHLLIIYS